MFLGLLIGIICAGILATACNPDSYQTTREIREQRANFRLLGASLIFIGFWGSVGWLLEYNHVL